MNTAGFLALYCIDVARMNPTFQRLARRQLSRVMSDFRATAERSKPPRDGWISAIREALGMSAQNLAREMGVGASSVFRLEERERDGGVTIRALSEAAAALNCELVYALVPKRETPGPGAADAVLDRVIMSHALAVAKEDLRRVSNTMALEDQAVGGTAAESQLRQRAAELAANPKELWRRVNANALPARRSDK